MGKLSETRRKLRLHSILIAADMIENFHQGGILAEEMNLTDKEFKIFCEENVRTSKELMKMALKYYKTEDYNDEQ